MENIFKINLHRFDASEGSIGAETGPAPDSPAAADDEAEKVIYGISPMSGQADDSEDAAQNENSEEGSDSDKDENPEAEFNGLIKGKFKEAFDKKVSSIVKSRFKTVDNIRKTNDAMRPIIDVLAQKYGTDNLDELKDKIESDSSLWEDAAEEAGVSAEQFRSMKLLERQNLEARRTVRELQARERQREIFDDWQREAAAVKADYPGFDLAEEMENPEFKSLISNSVPMRKAYEVIHMNDILKDISAFSAKKGEELAALRIKQRQSRPDENMNGKSSGVVIKSDPSKLTKADRDEIRKRVARGDKSIMF